MTYKEELVKSRERASVAYTDFDLHIRENKNGLFCFFEGERGGDNQYYVPRIKDFIKTYHPIRCAGRDKVMEVHRLINNHREYDKYKKAYFIDRDFNEPLEGRIPPIFETPFYSIENFYVSVDVFKEILKSPLLLSEVSEAYKVCLELFINRQLEFHAETLLFNAWYACLIEIKNQTGEKTGVSLDEKFPKNFIEISLKAVTSKYDLEKIKQAFPYALEVTEERLKEKIAEFSNCEQYKVFRGKYEMYFLVTFINLIIEDSISRKEFMKDKVKYSFPNPINNEYAISFFSAYADTPESLREYLKLVTQ